MSRVSALVSNFEQLSSPPTESRKNFLLSTSLKDESPLSRIQRLKQDVSDIVNVDAIEEKVSSHKREDEENPIMATLKDIDGKKLHLASINDTKLQESLKNGWECKVCKTNHSDVPLFFFCAAPDDYDTLDGTERANRAKLSADLCTIEKISTHYIRALLELPLKQEQTSNSGKAANNVIVVTWGVWVAVSSADFDKVVNNWNSHESLVLEGKLNNSLPVYKNALGMPVTVTTRPGGFRPLVSIKSSDNQLATDANSGITSDRLSSLVEFVFHTSK